MITKRILLVLLMSLYGGTMVNGDERQAALFTSKPHFDVVAKLDQAGFEVNTLHYPGLNDQSLAWEKVKNYNVLVVIGLGMSNADSSLSGISRPIKTRPKSPPCSR